MSAKTVLITGANSGIGLATARGLAELGYAVVMVCRDRTRGEAARAAVAEVASGPAPVLFVADLASQASIRALSRDVHARYAHIDVLVNNAGAAFARRDVTVDGIERTFAVNQLAPFLLTSLLLDLVVDAPAGRIVMVSSEIHARRIDFDNLQGEKRYAFFPAYQLSKLENILFANELARRLEHTAVTVNALSPGPARTNFGDPDMKGPMKVMLALMKNSPLFKSAAFAARTSIYLATSPEVATTTGEFWMREKLRKPKAIVHDVAVASRLWAVCSELTGARWDLLERRGIAV